MASNETAAWKRLPGSAQRYQNIRTGETISHAAYLKIQRGGVTVGRFRKARVLQTRAIEIALSNIQHKTVYLFTDPEQISKMAKQYIAARSDKSRKRIAGKWQATLDLALEAVETMRTSSFWDLPGSQQDFVSYLQLENIFEDVDGAYFE